VWRVELSEGAKRDLKRCDRQTARRILRFLRERIAVAQDPRRIGKPLQSPRFGDFWSYRAGDWRIICRIEDEEVIVLVLNVGHRRTVYRSR
jgi:mRNA interferase RelE/StbE